VHVDDHQRGASQVTNDLDPELAGVELLALLDGFTPHVVAGSRVSETALALLDRRLDRTFSPTRTT
jgi:hypothetical protein